jgi:hypothetical protein
MTSKPFEGLVDIARSVKQARAMKDKTLVELHAHGRQSLEPGMWEVLDEELRRRARGLVPATSMENEEDRYPATRVVVVVLKVCAGVIWAASVLGALLAYQTYGMLVSILSLLTATIVAVGYWSGAELLTLLIDIESNTRKRGNK